ncbi:MAG: ribbon-helix-helix protein, CopG family [Desulfonauticus sp.]|nr:ribbon-helix-helix protein, CopG family [Desulfonauticus sp.]
MAITQIQLTERQRELLEQLAEAQNISFKEIIKQAIDDFLKTQKAIKAAGRFNSGVPDLSENHDKYLEEAFSK